MNSHRPIVSSRIPEVDGLRGFAILSVLIFHFNLFAGSEGTGFWNQLYSRLVGLGWAGVDLFLVLSGFLITSILLQSRDRRDYYRGFYFRRVLRIFPLYYASLAVYYGIAPAILLLIRHGGYVHSNLHNFFQPSAQLFAWLYIVNWRMGLISFAAIPQPINHFWSLSIEEQFYLAWPFVVRRLNRGRLVILCVAFAVLSLGLRLALHHEHMRGAAYVLTFCRLDSLAIGATIACAACDDRNWSIATKVAPWLTAAASTALVVLLGVTRQANFGYFWMGSVGITLWGLLFGGLLVTALDTRKNGFVRRVTSGRFPRFFGKYSYCMYVCHQPLILFMAELGINGRHLTTILGSRLLATAAVYAIDLLLVTLISLASWHLFEKRFLGLKDRLPFGGLASAQSA